MVNRPCLGCDAQRRCRCYDEQPEASHPVTRPAPVWATGWYVRKRHIVGPNGHAALCSAYTGLYPDGRRKDQRKYDVPAADTDAVMALPACKLCLRKAGL